MAALIWAGPPVDGARAGPESAKRSRQPPMASIFDARAIEPSSGVLKSPSTRDGGISQRLRAQRRA
eukprot:9703399-Lingulodinium_polyedra.AAC.1